MEDNYFPRFHFNHITCPLRESAIDPSLPPPCSEPWSPAGLDWQHGSSTAMWEARQETRRETSPQTLNQQSKVQTQETKSLVINLSSITYSVTSGESWICSPVSSSKKRDESSSSIIVESKIFPRSLMCSEVSPPEVSGSADLCPHLWIDPLMRS